ncbi:MAG: hypothetical protein ACJ71K_12455 [Nitrososphaeraceae archaeon]
MAYTNTEWRARSDLSISRKAKRCGLDIPRNYNTSMKNIGTFGSMLDFLSLFLNMSKSPNKSSW